MRQGPGGPAPGRRALFGRALGAVLHALVAGVLATTAVPALLAAAPAAAAEHARGPLDRSIRKINLSAYVTRIHGLEPICVQSKRVLSMNIRYADLDGDNVEDAVMEAVTCRSTDGTPDVIGVLAYQHPDSVREIPSEHSKPSDHPVYANRVGPVRLELIDSRLVRWFAVAAEACSSGKPRAPGRRLIVYRWSGTMFVVDRIMEVPSPGRC